MRRNLAVRRGLGALATVVAVWACGGQSFQEADRGDAGDASSSGSTASGGSGSSNGSASSSNGGSTSSGSGGSSSSTGGSSGASNSSSSGASSSSGTSSGADGGRVPLNHRPNDAQCLAAAPAGDCAIHGPVGQCSSDAACTAGTDGRCIESNGGAVSCSCTYDTCMQDTDCPTGETCACHGSPYTNGDGNTCIKSGCRVDADCGTNGYCSPAYDTSSCGSLLGYFCHTPEDQCVNDSDCTDGGLAQKCTYSSSALYWKCMTYGLCP
jgi:hypothetical protein